MLDIGWSELLLIAVIAIVVIGPRDLPAALRQAGKWMGAVRRMAADFQGQVNEAMKEADLEELRRELQELKRTAHGFNPAATTRQEIRGAIEGTAQKPVGSPTPVTTPDVSSSQAGVVMEPEDLTSTFQPEIVAAPERPASGSDVAPAPRPSDLPAPAVAGAAPDFAAAEKAEKQA